MKTKKANSQFTIAAVLHNVRSVHNVGSIFRTADAAGISKIYLCGITPAPIDRFKEVRPDFAKVSLGAEKNIAWEHCSDTKAAIEKLKRDRWNIFAVEQSKKSVPYYSVRDKLRGKKKNKSVKIALVFGNEVDGLTSDIMKMADKILEIPMSGKKESLNVAVAFGIVAYGLQW